MWKYRQVYRREPFLPLRMTIARRRPCFGSTMTVAFRHFDDLSGKADARRRGVTDQEACKPDDIDPIPF